MSVDSQVRFGNRSEHDRATDRQLRADPPDAEPDRRAWKCRGRRPGRSCWRWGSPCWAPAWRRTWPCPSSVRCCSSSAWAAGSGNCCPAEGTCTNRWSSRRCVPGRSPGSRARSTSSVPGMAGYRFQLPEKVHPISAGVKGGIVGGLVMPIPALAYGLLSGHGLWFPINLLAGMVVPGISGETEAQLEQFQLGRADPGDRHSRHVLGDVRAAFRRRLADAAADPGRPRDCRGRAHAAAVDGSLLRLHGDHQPAAPEACELALVHRLAGGVRPGHVDRRDSIGEGPGPAGRERPEACRLAPRSPATDGGHP